MSTDILTVENVSLSYDGRCVLRNCSFSLPAGAYLCVIGENGSGKSTLMKALLSLKAPDCGRIAFGEGVDRREIGYLPQQTLIQRDFPASVAEIVLSGCQNKMGFRPFYTKKEKALADSRMDALGITGLSRHSYRELSGGQQQRVLLARALCATEKLLLLDEPVAGLDPVVTAELYELISGLNRSGITVIMVSHDLDAALRNASHILHLAGEPLYFGTADGWLESDAGKAFSKGGQAE